MTIGSQCISCGYLDFLLWEEEALSRCHCLGTRRETQESLEVPSAFIFSEEGPGACRVL